MRERGKIMLKVITDEGKFISVCESCGCVHTNEDEIFHIGDIELCTDCANIVAIEDPGCHFDCARCYGDCLILADASPYVS